MATWNQSLNSGGLLAGIGGMNSNAPRASDVDTALAYIRQNNEMERSGANNIGLQALSGIGATYAGLKQYDQQQAAEAFNQAHADAWATGKTDGLRAFARQNPQFVEQAQKAVSGLNDEQRADMTNQAAGLRFALAQGPDSYAKYLKENAGNLARVGADPNLLSKIGAQDPQGAAHLFDMLGMSGQGDKYFDIVDKQQGREIDRGRLAETIRSNQAGEALTAQGQYISASNAAADRAQRAQIHSDNVAMKLQELGMKQQENGRVDPKLVRDLNSDINGFSKNYSAMRGAADNLQVLGKRNTPAAQLGMIFNYMKSLDPQSVVREGEQVQVKRTDGVFGTLQNYVNQLSNGKMLNDSQVSDLINTSKLMANTEGKKFNQQMDDYLSTYGDSLPGGLTKQLQSRKAKLYDDIQQQPGQQQAQQATSGGQSLREGVTATNPKTGQKLIYRSGQWQPM